MESKGAKYIAFDTETSGLNSLRNNLLSVCFVILDKNLNEINKINYDIKHKEYIVSPDALKVNKIDLIKHNNTKWTIESANKNLIKILENCNLEFRLVPIGHNLQFDINFIKNSGLLSEKKYSKYISCNGIDTITTLQYLKLIGDFKYDQSLSLTSLKDYFNININGDLHNAETDILITIEILRKLKECNLLLHLKTGSFSDNKLELVELDLLNKK